MIRVVREQGSLVAYKGKVRVAKRDTSGVVWWFCPGVRLKIDWDAVEDNPVKPVPVKADITPNTMSDTITDTITDTTTDATTNTMTDTITDDPPVVKADVDNNEPRVEKTNAKSNEPRLTEVQVKGRGVRLFDKVTGRFVKRK